MGFLPWPESVTGITAGEAGHGGARLGKAGVARPGAARRGEAGHGQAGISIKRQAVSRSNHRNKWSI
jgi:hypothetical protein